MIFSLDLFFIPNFEIYVSNLEIQVFKFKMCVFKFGTEIATRNRKK